jgi:hypothetical protein
MIPAKQGSLDGQFHTAGGIPILPFYFSPIGLTASFFLFDGGLDILRWLCSGKSEICAIRLARQSILF